MYERLIAGFFMPRGPKDHLRQHGGEVNSFGRERVNGFSAVGRIGFDGNDAIGFEAAKTVRKDVAGDFFVGVKEFVKCLIASNHHVANDQQGPAISEHFDRSVEGTPGTAEDNQFLLGHAGKAYYFRLHNASVVGKLAPPRLLRALGVSFICT